MGWSIYIGNAELQSNWSPEDRDCSASWVVETLELPEAPNFSDSGQHNYRWPSYSQWANFTRAVGLYDLFHDRDEGLLNTDAKAVPLNRGHLEQFEDALVQYKAEHPESTIAEFCPCNECVFMGKDDTIKHNPAYDGNLARLEWLIWWTRWSLDNCERPAIYGI
jgi:hypothetical protein